MFGCSRSLGTDTQAESMFGAIALTLFQERDSETKLDKLGCSGSLSQYRLGTGRAREG